MLLLQKRMQCRFISFTDDNFDAIKRFGTGSWGEKEQTIWVRGGQIVVKSSAFHWPKNKSSSEKSCPCLLCSWEVGPKCCVRIKATEQNCCQFWSGCVWAIKLFNAWWIWPWSTLLLILLGLCVVSSCFSISTGLGCSCSVFTRCSVTKQLKALPKNTQQVKAMIAAQKVLAPSSIFSPLQATSD